LRKDRERRVQHIADLKVSLEELRDDTTSGKISTASRAATPPPPDRSSSRTPVLATGLVVLLAAAGGAYWWLKRTPPVPSRNEWVQITNFSDSVAQPALSPDGRMLTFTRSNSTFNGPGQIYLKMLPSGEPVQLTHDETGKLGPVFAPDGS